MNLFELCVKIGADVTDVNKGIDETGKKTSDLGEKIKSGLATVGKAAVVGVTAAATAIGTIGTKAIQAYADYEQLVGGVETLFGTSAGSAEEYAAQTGEAVDDVRMKWASLSRAQNIIMYRAQNAFKTAGLSANEYMETVTSFAAALVSSMGGDTEAAAQRADLAITDMADNANKMGSSMESIQNAYQGFAKQNYSMLDNLKLGYGGTKTEMERLLADAEKLTGVKYDINNLNDVYQAIHAVQEEMGITGTTAKEAASTLEGSMASAKAAWDNFMNGSGDADQLADAFATAADNIVKNLAEIFATNIPGTPHSRTATANTLNSAIRSELKIPAPT